MEHLVCELARKGRLLVGEPYFEGGVPVVVDRKGAGEASVGDLVVVKLGRGRARLERVLGPANRIEAVLEGLLWQEGARGSHPPLPPVPPDEPAWKPTPELTTTASALGVDHAELFPTLSRTM